MSQAAASVLICAVEGTALTPAEEVFFKHVAPAGVTLFPRNIAQDHRETAALIKSLQSLRPAGAPPLVVAIDQEGGRVARIKADGFNPGPAMLLAGGRHDAAALAEIRGLAKALGENLRSLGFNIDFAPVLDVLTEPTNQAIGDRSFGTVAEAVTLRAGAFLKGLQDAGVKGCLKHFPGQGDAKVDTHLGAAVISSSRDELFAREIAPFRALLSETDMVMISHCIYPALAPGEASRSPEIMQGLLRRELGFTGVIVSDDMNMGALPQEKAAWQEAIVQAVAAGADMVLVCRHLERYELAYAALSDAEAKSQQFAARLKDAAARVTQLRHKLTSV